LALESHHHEEKENISLWSMHVLTLLEEPDTVTFSNELLTVSYKPIEKCA
jgi:hypothetical protein